MTQPTTEDLVRQCLEGNAVGGTESFGSLALAKIAEKIADFKQEIAVSMFTPSATPAAT